MLTLIDSSQEMIICLPTSTRIFQIPMLLVIAQAPAEVPVLFKLMKQVRIACLKKYEQCQFQFFPFFIEQEENNIEILEEHTISEPKNINVFDAEESPSKVKNNFLLEKQEKITKANVDLVFNRNDWKTKNDEETENPENLDEDEIAIAKMTTYLKHN